MNSRSKTPSGTVKDTGALATSTLVGIDPHNYGLRIQIDEDQTEGSKNIEGQFIVLSAGSGTYASDFEPYVGRKFGSAEEMIDAVRESSPKATYFLQSTNLKVEK